LINLYCIENITGYFIFLIFIDLLIFEIKNPFVLIDCKKDSLPTILSILLLKNLQEIIAPSSNNHLNIFSFSILFFIIEAIKSFLLVSEIFISIFSTNNKLIAQLKFFSLHAINTGVSLFLHFKLTFSFVANFEIAMTLLNLQA